MSVYNSDGALVDAFSFGASGYDEAHHVAVDPSGNIIIAGGYTIQINCDPTGINQGDHLTTAGAADGSFLVKFTPERNYVWQRQIGVSSDTEFFDLEVDANGGIWTIGKFEGSANFDPNALFSNDNLIAQGYSDGFISWIDTDGDYVFGGQLTGSGQNESAESLTVSADGSIYIAGYYNTELYLDFDNDGDLHFAGRRRWIYCKIYRRTGFSE